MYYLKYMFKNKLCFLVVFCITWGLMGCQTMVVEETGAIDPVFFPKPPSMPRIQFLASFSGPEDVGIEGPGFLETFIVGEPEENEFIVKAYGGAIYAGKLYVCDVGRKRIAVIDVANKTFEFMPLDPRLLMPFNITIDKTMVLDKMSGEYLRSIGRKAEFTFEENYGSEEFGIISDLEVDLAGNLYVTDMLRSQVIKFDSSGRFERAYSGPGSTSAHLLRPKGIALDRENRIWVADSGPAEAVKIYNQEGEFLMFFGLHG